MKTLLKNLFIWMPILVIDRLLRLFVIATTTPKYIGVWYTDTYGIYLDNIQHPKTVDIGTYVPVIGQHPSLTIAAILLVCIIIMTIALRRVETHISLMTTLTPLFLGAISNGCDLILTNSVTDPLVFSSRYFGLAINLADMCLLLGITSFLVAFTKAGITHLRTRKNWGMLYVGTTKTEAELFFN